ncbi:DUF502 domain-containing protein [Uliginosibacterium sp. H1]|uniref:DUF502 domain-containing protein n=1 Tax=Uliginosibacterium sp. H1 TaxID=3114757 RepID=UPI002E18EF8B|nr:DUF502 domain-containing protein [Uliginosibacterium sp. H1]
MTRLPPPVPDNATPGIKEALSAMVQPLLTGLLALAPLALTVVLLGWAARIVRDFIGPNSLIGRGLAAVGFTFASNPMTAYAIGAVLLLGVVYAVGVVVQTRLRHALSGLIDSTVRRIPFISTLYDTTTRFIGIFDRDAKADVAAMSPVWVFFGESRGTAVLALMPNPVPVLIDDQEYLTVLVPTAPVPIGGGLFYVRRDQVRPADIGVEQLSSVYLSMGLTPPTPAGAPARKQ